LDDNSSSTIISSLFVMVENAAPFSTLSRLDASQCEPHPGAFGVHSQYREPQLGITPETPVYSVVKWFNPKRDLGFVARSDGSGDAFLHRNALAHIGIDAVEQCAVLKVHILQGESGPYVSEVLSIDNSTAVPAIRHRRKTRLSGPSVEATGTVKSFNAKTGYGFIARDGGGSDVFFHVADLKRFDDTILSKGQRVVTDVIEGRKGPKARGIRLALSGLRGGKDE
jgi:cold shock protein